MFANDPDLEQGAAAIARAGNAFVGPPQSAADFAKNFPQPTARKKVERHSGYVDMFASGDNIDHSQYIGTGFVDKDNEYGDYVMPDNFKYPMGSNRSDNHNYMDMSVARMYQQGTLRFWSPM